MSSHPAQVKEPSLAPVQKEASAWGVEALNERNRRNQAHQASIAGTRAIWIRENRYYYGSLVRLLRFLTEPGKRVLNIRCQTGLLLAALRPVRGVGIEISNEMVSVARTCTPDFEYHLSFPENFRPAEKFDYILFDGIGDTVDVQKALLALKPGCERSTRLFIYTYNHFWQPLISLAQRLKLKVPQTEQNWLSEQDIRGLLELSGYEWLKTYRALLFPKYIPLLSEFLNRFLAKLPLLNRLCLIEVLVARSLEPALDPSCVSVSVIIPCKNERGNIEDAVNRMPQLGQGTEIIFCDDKSTDGTADEIRRMQCERRDLNIKLVSGPGICKSKNVWTGFRAAEGDILMILDADLTVMPEELPYFFDAIVSGKAEFVNGSRLVYPIPRAAMKSANMVGNKFFSLVFSFLLRQPVKDTLCGTKVLWRSDWQRIEPMVDSWGIVDRWGDYELLFGAAKLNLKLVDQPVHYQERIYGSTKMTKVFHNGLIMLQMCWHGFKKLRLQY